MFGSGFSPIAPGTAGSLATIPLVYLTLEVVELDLAIGFFLGLTFLSYVILNFYMKKFGQGEKDPKWVVQDEVSGFLLAALILKFLGTETILLFQIIALFVTFRIFDIFKLFPANYFDKSEKINAIMHDDLIAGIYSGLSSYFILSLIP